MSDAESDPVRLVARQLSGYLCGTHSGLLGLSAPARRLGHPSPENIATVHRSLNLPRSHDEFELGVAEWKPEERRRLAERLRDALSSPEVVELVFFGSQAGGDRTGFSDVDAILVISDEAADSPTRLRRLRPAVLAAQRAVLSYHPLQHHGFEVVTPRLLRRLDAAVGLPSAALEGTQSLGGKSVGAGFARVQPSYGQLQRLAARLGRSRTWPAHRWYAYLELAMFELLPTIYLQARGESIAKAASFAAARSDFGEAWWPYDVLAEVRASWPRLQNHALESAATVVRNPWVASAVSRRIPARVPRVVEAMLSAELLRGLQSLGQRMVRQLA